MRDLVTSLTINNLPLSLVGPVLELLKENFELEINIGSRMPEDVIRETRGG